MPGLNSDTNPPRIAFCISGQVRDYNKMITENSSSVMGVDHIIECFRKNGFHVDVFGHTWDECPTPLENETIQFRNLNIGSKQEVYDWIAEDPWNRTIPYNTSITDIYKDIHKDNIPQQDREQVLIDSGVAALAQYWSNAEAMMLIQDIDKYDLIIRARWDLSLQLCNDVEPIIGWKEDCAFQMQYNINLLSNWLRHDKMYERANMILPNNSWIYYRTGQHMPSWFYSEDCVEDVFFAMKPNCGLLMCLKQENKNQWKNDLDTMIRWSPVQGRVCSHNIWSSMYKFYQVDAYLGMQSVFGLHGSYGATREN